MPRWSPESRRAALKRAIPSAAQRRLRRASDWGYRYRNAVASLRSAANETEHDQRSFEGVVVLGMHRSGTSLITRLISLLGFALCREDDLLVGRKGNPRGHWESISLLAFNDRLLDELGTTWFCPPSMNHDELARMLDRHGTDALARLRRSHPERPWVWKDPRTSVLMPFWSTVLGERAAYVLIVRHPFEVSDSMAKRNGCTPAFSLALWERYTRQAMVGAAGRPMLVCTYDEVLSDPPGWCERLVTFLGAVGAPELAVNRTVADGFATKTLRHSHKAWTELQAGPLISHAQVELAKAVSVFTAQASYVLPQLPPESAGTEELFAEIREHVAKRSGGRRHTAGLPESMVTPRGMRTDTSRTVPAVSVVLADGRHASEASIAALSKSLPAGSEILLAAPLKQRLANATFLQDVSINEIDCAGPPDDVESLARGVEAARGRIVLVADGRLVNCDPWYEPLKRELASAGVAAVGPVLRFESRLGERYDGRAFSDESLIADLVAHGEDHTPADCALLLAELSAYDRRVLAAAGGIDSAFDSPGSAIIELSIRLWRMGFHCRAVPEVEVLSGEPPTEDGDGEGQLYDRMRIAALHFDAACLVAFNEHVRSLPLYNAASERLAASNVEHRRAAIEAVCAFSIGRYFSRFPFRSQARARTGRSADRVVLP